MGLTKIRPRSLWEKGLRSVNVVDVRLCDSVNSVSFTIFNDLPAVSSLFLTIMSTFNDINDRCWPV